MAKVTILRGYSGSGKSHWANQQDALVVSRDHIRQQITHHAGKTVLDNDGEQFVTKLETAQIEAALKAGVNVVVDNTNLRAKFARRYIDLAVQNGAEWEVKDFSADFMTCIIRNDARDNPVPTRVIEDQARRFPLGTWPVLEPSTPKVSWETYERDRSLPEAYIFDIDGTLALLPDGYSPYDPGHYPHDALNEPVAAILEIVQEAGAAVILLTGREGTNENHAATKEWLRENDVVWDELHMRFAGDQRNDAIIKAELFDQYIANRYNVLGVFDDRLRVRRMWYARGVPLFSVGDPDANF